MTFCGHRGEHGVSRGQSPGHATTDDRASNQCPTSAGVHMRMIRSWNVRKAFFNADLNVVIYVHLGPNLCKA